MRTELSVELSTEGIAEGISAIAIDPLDTNRVYAVSELYVLVNNSQRVNADAGYRWNVLSVGRSIPRVRNAPRSLQTLPRTTGKKSASYPRPTIPQSNRLMKVASRAG